MSQRRKILVTNDDGIDSLGLHELARAVSEHGEVTVVAPDSEFSGSGASIGSVIGETPVVHRRDIDGLPGSANVWAVEGPPALCVMLVTMGAFDVHPDLVVSGINPGANVGRSVYHSGTIGACLTGRNAGLNGIAVSQALQKWSAAGQAWNEAVATIDWANSASICAAAAKAMLDSPPNEASVLNINVPDRDIAEIDTWAWTSVAEARPKVGSSATMEPREGHDDSFGVKIAWGQKWDAEVGSDVRAVADGTVSLTWLSKLTAVQPSAEQLNGSVADAMNDLFV